MEKMQIKAAVVRTKGAPFNIEPVSLRTPVADEVLVRIVATGMCHTDMIIRDQYYPVPLPVVLSHEGAGIVGSVGPQVKHLQVGDHVVLTYGRCGHCMPRRRSELVLQGVLQPELQRRGR